MEENKFSLKSCLANLDLMIAGTVLAILIVLTFAGVIWRYFLGKRLPGWKRYRRPAWSGLFFLRQEQLSAWVTMLPLK